MYPAVPWRNGSLAQPPGQPEQPVLEYPLQQWRLLPLLAGTYAADNFSRSFFGGTSGRPRSGLRPHACVPSAERSLLGVCCEASKNAIPDYIEFRLGMMAGDKSERQAELGREIHAISSASKPYVSFLARGALGPPHARISSYLASPPPKKKRMCRPRLTHRSRWRVYSPSCSSCPDAAQQCREACGGHGYLAINKLGVVRDDNDPNRTEAAVAAASAPIPTLTACGVSERGACRPRGACRRRQ